jgi:hypothetical protein
MAGVGLLDRVDREGADRVDAELIDVSTLSVRTGQKSSIQRPELGLQLASNADSSLNMQVSLIPQFR